MEVLRIILTQNSANYRKEETVINKMTYPLPPFSTIIGALHSACGYKSYHEMDISIQGKYGAMHKEAYTDYCFLNRTEDDRGILVKMKNSNYLSTAFDKVAKAKKSQGNSFKEGTTIEVINDELLNEYRNLKDLLKLLSEFKKVRLKTFFDIVKKRKKRLTMKKKMYDKKSEEFDQIVERENEIKNLEKEVNDRFKEYKEENYEKPYSKFKVLTTSLKYYEILNDIELIIHIKSDKETLNDIKENIYNLKSIGRSEDFVDIKDISFVNVDENIEEEVISNYSAYLDYDLIKNESVDLRSKTGISVNGTKYYISKDYIIADNKRVFNKKKVVYASEYAVDDASKGVFIDKSEGQSYIVNFN